MVDALPVSPHAFHVLKASVFLSLLALLFLRSAPADPSQAAVSIRVYQASGPSYIHLYLYTLDGKLIRQLTETPGLDDISPMFDPAGKSVFFFRKAATPNLKEQEGSYLLDIPTGKLTRLSTEEAKLQEKKCQPSIKPVAVDGAGDTVFQDDPKDGKGALSFHSPNGYYQLVRKPNPAYSESNWDIKNGPPFWWFLRPKDSSALIPMTSLSGYPASEFANPDGYLATKKGPFIAGPGYAALFMTRHIDSTMGNALWVLDLKSKRWIAMSSNSGWVYTVPGQTGVIFVHCSRYENLKNSGLSVNCSYLEFWGSDFIPVQLGLPTSLFHGAAIFYNPDQTLMLPDPGFGS